MKRNKIIYWIATGLLCALMLFSASMYFLKTDEVKSIFEGFNYPSYIVIPLATAKLLGIVAIITRRSRMLLEWAYAGFFFDLVLAFTAHWNAEDGGHGGALMGLVFLTISYIFERRI